MDNFTGTVIEYIRKYFEEKNSNEFLFGTKSIYLIKKGSILSLESNYPIVIGRDNYFRRVMKVVAYPQDGYYKKPILFKEIREICNDYGTPLKEFISKVLYKYSSSQ